MYVGKHLVIFGAQKKGQKMDKNYIRTTSNFWFQNMVRVQRKNVAISLSKVTYLLGISSVGEDRGRVSEGKGAYCTPTLF